MEKHVNEIQQQGMSEQSLGVAPMSSWALPPCHPDVDLGVPSGLPWYLAGQTFIAGPMTPVLLRFSQCFSDVHLGIPSMLSNLHHSTALTTSIHCPPSPQCTPIEVLVNEQHWLEKYEITELCSSLSIHCKISKVCLL